MPLNNILNNNQIYSSETTFLLRTYKANTIKTLNKIDQNRVVFILDGECEIKHNDISHLSLCAKHFFFLSTNDCCVFNFTADTVILFLIFDWIENDYFRQAIHLLTPYAAKRTISTLSPLQFNPFIDTFTNNMCECLKNELNIRRFYEIKLEEVFFLILAFYSKDELVNFFYSILKKDTDFSYLVSQNFIISQTIEELAFVTHCSVSTFKRKFKITFNDTPHNWIMRQKAKFIYRDLGDQSLSLTDISDKYQFSAFSHFSAFCKKTFGIPPSEIRKRMKENDVLLVNKLSQQR